ncbi:MAG: phosphotransferase [Pseudomonadota bacterium]
MIDAFLDAHGFGPAARAPLPGDASFRRYTRLLGGPRPAMLMESPAEPVAPFLTVARHIAGIGLSAPEIIAEDLARGLLLIEDFGDATHAALLDGGTVPEPLYAEAVAALAVLHEAPPPPGLPAWDAAAMARATAATFLDWWWPAALGVPPTPAQRAGLDQALHDMLAPFAQQGFVHRDYFPANLMRLEGRAGARACGIIDFQDAALGHPAYDLVSLVEDARRDVAPVLRAAMVSSYLARRPGLDADDFRAAMAACAAQRHLRVAALWVRLDRRDGKPHYLAHGPRCWALLDAALEHPATRPLAEFLDAHVPRSRRGNPGAPKGLDEA